MARRKATPAERARDAKRESKTLDFKDCFNPGENWQWPELVKDFVAMANSGGGILVIGVRDNGTPSSADVSGVLSVDTAVISDKIARYTGVQFGDFEIYEGRRGRKKVAIIEIGGATEAPIAFTNVGSYEVPDKGDKQKQKTAFSKGTVYMRHGAKSAPATTADLRAFIDRRLDQIRKGWMSGLRQIVDAPPGSRVALVQAADEGGTPTRIQLTDDPAAPLFARLRADDTHPHRQTEVIDELNRRLGARAHVNPYDILSVRRIHGITEDSRPTFAYEPNHASTQYSDAFIDWLEAQFNRDRNFFEKAKATFAAQQRKG